MKLRTVSHLLRILAVLVFAGLILIAGVALAQRTMQATEGGERLEAGYSPGQPDGMLQVEVPQPAGEAASETGIKPEVEAQAAYADGFAPDDNVALTAADAPSATFSYYTVSGPELQPRTTTNNQTYSANGCVYMATGTSTGLLTGTGLHIPDDSVIKYIRLYYNDTNASAGVDAYLTRYAPGSATNDLVSAGSANAFSGGYGFVVSDEITVTVNNTSYAYILYGWPDAASSTLQVCGIRVAYYAPFFGATFMPMVRR